MTIAECYNRLNGDYSQAKQRLMSDRLIDKFIRKFPADDSITILRTGVEQGNNEEAFRGAHTLKGVAANLAFTDLQQKASELTEQLRSLDNPADPVLLAAVEDSYRLVIDTIALYEQECES